MPAVGKKNIPVFLRSDIIFLPEGSDKVRTAGKAALVGNLLYIQIGRLEQNLGFENHKPLYPLDSGKASLCLDCAGQVLWGDLKLIGIKFKKPVLTEILLYEIKELIGNPPLCH